MAAQHVRSFSLMLVDLQNTIRNIVVVGGCVPTLLRVKMATMQLLFIVLTNEDSRVVLPQMSLSVGNT